MSLPRPDINHIRAEDLASDDRLRELYVGAVRHGYWRNSPTAVLEFTALAEKALQDDKHGTPGKLFYSLIKRKDSSMVTQAVENRAMARFPSYVRQEMVDAACNVSEESVAAVVEPDDGQQALVDRDVGYAHAVMMQCFLPQRPIAHREYETSHGRASLLIEAGQIANPNRPPGDGLSATSRRAQSRG